MSLKRSYATEAEVPTERKADYVLKGDRYVLDVEGFDNIEGVLAKNTELVGKVNGHAAELAAKDTEINRLTGELSNARGSTLPRGHKAVPTADAELVEAVKAEGVTTADAFKTLKTEHGDYKQKAEEREREKHATTVGEAMKWDRDKTALLVPAVYDLSQVQVRDGKDGAKEVVAKVKQADGSFIEKPFAEVVTSTPTLSALVPSLTTQKAPDGTELPEHGAGGGSGGGDILEKRLSAQRAAQAANPNPLMPKAPAATA